MNMHINLEKIVRKNQNGIIKKYKHNKYLDEFRFLVHFSWKHQSKQQLLNPFLKSVHSWQSYLRMLICVFQWFCIQCKQCGYK